MGGKIEEEIIYAENLELQIFDLNNNSNGYY